MEFYGTKTEEKNLRILLKSTPLHGTYWKYAIDGLKQLGFEFVYSSNKNLEYLKNLISDKTPPIISLNAKFLGAKDHVNHVVVVVGTDETSILIHDPEIGPSFKIDTESFISAWNDRENRIGYIKKPLL